MRKKPPGSESVTGKAAPRGQKVRQLKKVTTYMTREGLGEPLWRSGKVVKMRK
jgi:hypothetical protein